MIIKTISRCNQLLSARTSNPMVSMIRLSDVEDLQQILRPGLYTIWLREWTNSCPSVFGRMECDFSDGTLIFLQPGKTAVSEILRSESGHPEGRLLCFHASVFDPLKTDKNTKGYSFFKYGTRESLHISQRERMVIEREIDEIGEELYWGIDEYCYTILSGRIKLLLDYVSRFYLRQFILRHDENQAIVDQIDRELDTFLSTGRAQYERLPSSEYFAELFDCSPAYLNDLLKHETGKDVENYVHCKRISFAEDLLCRGTESVEVIAARLGFPTDHMFCSMFSKLRGRSSENIISRSGLKHLS